MRTWIHLQDSKQPENLDPTPLRIQSSSQADEAMDVDLYGPSLPPHLRGKHSIQDSDPRHHLGDQQSMRESDQRHVSDEHSGQSEEPSRVVSARPRSGPGSRLHLQGKISPLYTNTGLPDQDQPRNDQDPLFFREVAMAHLPSQYTEEVETFRCILNLPDPRATMPRSCTSVQGLDDQKANRSLGQEVFLLCSHLVLESKMPLISFNTIFWLLTYLTVNILDPPLNCKVVQGGTALL